MMKDREYENSEVGDSSDEVCFRGFKVLGLSTFGLLSTFHDFKVSLVVVTLRWDDL